MKRVMFLAVVVACGLGFVGGGVAFVGGVAEAGCHSCPRKRVRRPKPKLRCVRCYSCTHRVYYQGCRAGYAPAGRDLIAPWGGQQSNGGRDLIPAYSPKPQAAPADDEPAPRRTHRRRRRHRKVKVIKVPEPTNDQNGWRFRVGLGGVIQGLNLAIGIYVEPRLSYTADGGFTYEASIMGTLFPGSWTLRDGGLHDYIFRGNFHAHPLGLGWTHFGSDGQRIAIMARLSMGVWNWLHNPRAPSPRFERLDFGGEVLARFTLAGGRVQLEPFIRLSYCAIRWPGHPDTATTEPTEGSSLPWLLPEFGVRIGVVFP